MLDSIKTLDSREMARLKQAVPELAERIQNLANEKIHWSEKLQAKEFARMARDPHSQAVFMTLTDQVFRLSKPTPVLKKFLQILQTHGIPSFFGTLDKLSLQALLVCGPFIPEFLSPLVVAIILKVMRFKTRKVILQGELENLNRYFANCRKEHLQVNINHLGDMVLGEKEAQKHLENYMDGLKNPSVTCVSVKISTLYSQVNHIAHEHTVSVLTGRLIRLLKIADEEKQKSGQQKLVYLDMEEYKDLTLTVDVFKRILNHPDHDRFSLGIALQAYVPDSFGYQKELTELAKSRRSRGGAPIRIRIVKGANMEMETFISSLNGWDPAPYDTKLKTDANYKRMVAYAFNPENLDAVKIGIGSHNIFEIAFASTLRSLRNLNPADIEFEMLEGVANPARRSVQDLIGPVLIYSPLAGEDEFLNAIAYLVRRLVENTDKENFLSHSFNLKPGTSAWNEEKNKFLASLDYLPQLKPAFQNHQQDRNQDSSLPAFQSIEDFMPDSPTHFSLPANQTWLHKEILEGIPVFDSLVPLEIAGNPVTGERKVLPCRNPSENGQALTQFAAANREDINQAVRFSKESDPTLWDSDENHRREILNTAAELINANRASLILCAMKNVAKGLVDLDAEISEAIDFTRYYTNAADYFRTRFPHIRFEGKGLVLVISPWNFPIAIPAGGMVAALATGNRVILKPSPHSLLATREVFKLFRKAGVPASALQFLPCHDEDAGYLAKHPDIDKVIFTGSAATADKILSARPDLDLSGETSGKNFFIITDSADKELAIKHLVESSFGYNGQKCSASSIAILTKEVYSDPKFKRQLQDAVESIPTGTLPHRLQSIVTPLIMPPKKDLRRALTTLEPEEQWLVKPKELEYKNLWSPAVKWDVPQGGFTHLTEFFGPVLGIMQANNLEHACEIANQSEFGLTAGLHSLDDREIKYFLETIRAGNLYVNNKTTGAVVGRQPFGGIKNSRRGTGGKAGGINYVLGFMDAKEQQVPEQHQESRFPHPLHTLIHSLKSTNWNGEPKFQGQEIQKVIRGANSCQFYFSQLFSREQSGLKAQRIPGQINCFRYRKVGVYTLRVHPEDSLSDVLLRLVAGMIAKNRISVSLPESMHEHTVAQFLTGEYLDPVRNLFSIHWQNDSELIEDILQGRMDRLAFTHPSHIPEKLRLASIRANLPMYHQRPLTEGRLLMLEQFDEQSITHTYHRYGNPGLKRFELETVPEKEEEILL